MKHCCRKINSGRNDSALNCILYFLFFFTLLCFATYNFNLKPLGVASGVLYSLPNADWLFLVSLPLTGTR